MQHLLHMVTGLNAENDESAKLTPNGEDINLLQNDSKKNFCILFNFYQCTLAQTAEQMAQILMSAVRILPGSNGTCCNKLIATPGNK